MTDSTLDRDFLARLEDRLWEREREARWLQHAYEPLSGADEACAEPLTDERPICGSQPLTSRRERTAAGVCDGLATGVSRARPAKGLDARLGRVEEGFSPMLVRMIHAAGMSHAECYTKAHVSRQHFSKILSNTDYRPTKDTVLAFAMSLQLDVKGTCRLLRAAGYALSRSQKRDIIIEYCIEEKLYDLMAVNELLLHYELPLLCA